MNFNITLVKGAYYWLKDRLQSSTPVSDGAFLDVYKEKKLADYLDRDIGMALMILSDAILCFACKPSRDDGCCNEIFHSFVKVRDDKGGIIPDYLQKAQVDKVVVNVGGSEKQITQTELENSIEAYELAKLRFERKVRQSIEELLDTVKFQVIDTIDKFLMEAHRN